MKTWTAAEVDDLVKEGAYILDVRGLDERCDGQFVATSQCIPLGELVERLTELPAKTVPIYAHCGSGTPTGRGAQACELLESHGYTCANLSGGYKGYISYKTV